MATIDLAKFLPYLVYRMLPLIDRAYAETLVPLEVTREMFRTMVILQNEGPQSLSRLSELTSINLSTLSRLVGRMEERKLLRRRKVRGSRNVEIALLPLGRKKCELLIPAALAYEQKVRRHFGAEEVAAIENMLHALHSAFRDSVAPESEDEAASKNTIA